VSEAMTDVLVNVNRECRLISQSPRLLLCVLVVVVLVLSFTSVSVAQESPVEKKKDRLIEPGEIIPPKVQLEKTGPLVDWDPEFVGEFSLIDQDGHPVTQETLRGKQWVVNFIFARCNLHCPQTCRKMMEFNRRLKDVDMKLVTLTVDPVNDTQEIMKKYSSIWGAEPDRWIFATGEPDEVVNLIRTGFKVTAWEEVGKEIPLGMEFAHDNHLLHIDETGRILGRYHSFDDKELTSLEMVLKGKKETPEQNRPAVIEAVEAQTKAVEEYERAQKGAATADPLDKLPIWAKRLPMTNAMLNALATILLLTGYIAIKAKRPKLHKLLMLQCFAISTAFLVCYLTYHYALHTYADVRGKPFTGTGSIRAVYFTILISHVILATAVPVLAIVTIVKGFRENWDSHKRWAKVTFPIWLYVSVTGVIIYWMLYQM